MFILPVEVVFRGRLRRNKIIFFMVEVSKIFQKIAAQVTDSVDDNENVSFIAAFVKGAIAVGAAVRNFFFVNHHSQFGISDFLMTNSINQKMCPFK